MKKFLAIIILCIFWNVNAYAKCSDDLDRSWKYGPDNYFMIYTFKNKTNKSIIITRVGLKDKSGNIMAEQKVYVRKCADCGVPVGDDDLYINPYGVNKILISVNHLNLEVAGSGFWSCKYGTFPVFNEQTNSSSSSSSSSTSSKSKQKSNNSGSSKSLLKRLLGKD